MPKTKSLDGMKFGKLTVINYLYSERYGTQGKTLRKYLCECECGNTKIVSSCDLLRGHVKSCGCLLKEVYISNHDNPKQLKHGQSKTRLYQCWYKMKRRCSSEPNWTSKGIVVCDEWEKFEPFMAWSLNNGYKDSLTLDRINPFGNYEPDNCRWATREQQANNRTDNRKIEIYGVTHTLAEWSKISGVKPHTISKRIEHGHPMSEWLVPTGENYFTNYNSRKSYFRKITINGETKSISEWSRTSGINRGTLESRINRGWPEEKWLSPVGTMVHKAL